MYSFEESLSEEEKERIIKEFLPFIKYTAHRLSWRTPPQLDVEDLISVGLMGLLDALGKFEEGRVKLKTYAEYRIKGAMLDELRSVEWLPRSAKKRVDELGAAHVRLQKKLGRMPEAEEVAEELGISLDEYFKTLQESSEAVSLRFEDFPGKRTAGKSLDVMECIPDPGASDPLEMLEKNSRKEHLAALIDRLTEKERLVLSLYYWEELTMKEIGRVLDLTESRVCQLRSQSVVRLKAMLRETEHSIP